MSGHSKWANIKHRKAAGDAKKAKVFTKIAKELTIAARSGGDPNFNPGLRLILAKARAANMPNKNIERAIKRGTGEEEGEEYVEILYEGYAPHGVGVLIEVVTDNRNRAVADLRHGMSKNGGNMASEGSVAWQFTRKGAIEISADAIPDNDALFLVAADAGAEDIEFDDPVTVYCPVESFHAVQEALRENGYEFTEANLIYTPNNPMELGREETEQVLRLLDILEELDDVQNVYSALDVSEEMMQALSEE